MTFVNWGIKINRFDKLIEYLATCLDMVSIYEATYM